jgi:hypothetical protein
MLPIKKESYYNLRQHFSMDPGLICNSKIHFGAGCILVMAGMGIFVQGLLEFTLFEGTSVA